MGVATTRGREKEEGKVGLLGCLGRLGPEPGKLLWPFFFSVIFFPFNNSERDEINWASKYLSKIMEIVP
jgi:hypothetical protein